MTSATVRLIGPPPCSSKSPVLVPERQPARQVAVEAGEARRDRVETGLDDSIRRSTNDEVRRRCRRPIATRSDGAWHTRRSAACCAPRHDGRNRTARTASARATRRLSPTPHRPRRSRSCRRRRASATTSYSCRRWSSRTGSEICGNRLTIGVQPSRIVRADTPPSRSGRRSARSNGRDQENELDPLAEAGRADLVEPEEIEEQELLREGEILLQQPVGEKRPPGVRQHALVLGEAHRPERSRQAAEWACASTRRRIAGDDPEAIVAEQLVEREDQIGCRRSGGGGASRARASRT